LSGVHGFVKRTKPAGQGNPWRRWRTESPSPPEG
jgi:hypothetical protein